MSIIVDPRDFLAAFGASWVLWLICNRCFTLAVFALIPAFFLCISGALLYLPTPLTLSAMDVVLLLTAGGFIAVMIPLYRHLRKK